MKVSVRETEGMEKGKKVLIFEDDRSFSSMLAFLLQRKGIKVSSCYNGEDAINTIGKESPDLIILDINMPFISGFKMCETIKAHPSTQAIPVIMLTARSKASDIETGFALGASEYLVKPVDHKKLLEMVRKHLS